MRTVAGILLLVIGVSFPMEMLLWLNARLHRLPPPRPRQVGAWLAFNFVLPVGLVLGGLSLMSARVAASPVIRVATPAVLIASAIVLVGLVLDAALGRRAPHKGGEYDP